VLPGGNLLNGKPLGKVSLFVVGREPLSEGVVSRGNHCQKVLLVEGTIVRRCC